MYCRNCGTQISENSKYCANCGEPQLAEIKKQPIEAKDRKWSLANKLALGGVVLAFIAALAAIVVIPQINQLLENTARSINPPQLPAEARATIDQNIQENIQLNIRGFDQSDFNYSVQASQQASFTKSMLLPYDEMWCVLISGVVLEDQAAQYVMVRKTGSVWSAHFELPGINFGGSPPTLQEWGQSIFRQYGCSIG